MKILVTGITSFIGSNVAKSLLQKGHEVYGIVRANSNNLSRLSPHENLYLIQRDMQSIDKMNKKALPKMDLCLHFAWEGVGVKGRMNEEIQNKNIENTIKLLTKCKELGIKRFVFAGSQAEYGQNILEHIKEKCSENVEEKPLSMYGKAKLHIAKEAAALCKEFQMEYLHLRIFSTYGYGDHTSSLVSTCIKNLREGSKLSLGECKQKWNYIYIDDCVAAILSLALDKNLEEKLDLFCKEDKSYKRHIINIASKDTRNLKDFALEIASIYGKEEKLHFDKNIESKEGIPYLNPDITKLEFISGFVPSISFREGVKSIENLYSMQSQA